MNGVLNSRQQTPFFGNIALILAVIWTKARMIHVNSKYLCGNMFIGAGRHAIHCAYGGFSCECHDQKNYRKITHVLYNDTNAQKIYRPTTVRAAQSIARLYMHT